MKLTPRELEIMGECALLGDQSLREIARRSKRPLYSIQRAIQRATEGGALSRVWLIDPATFGVCRVQCLLALGYERRADRSTLIGLLVAAEEIAFVAEIGGEYDLEIVALGRNELEAIRVIESLLERAGFTSRQRLFSKQARLAFFRRKHLTSQLKSEPTLEMSVRKESVKIDRIDWAILNAISADPEMLKRDIARAAEISLLTLERRLTKMHADGVLVGALYSLRAIDLGYQNFKVLVTLTAPSDGVREKIYSFARRQRNATNYRENIGGNDLELGVEVSHFSELLALKEQLVQEFTQNISTVNIVPRFKIHKFRPFPFQNGSFERLVRDG